MGSEYVVEVVYSLFVNYSFLCSPAIKTVWIWTVTYILWFASVYIVTILYLIGLL